VRRECQIGDAVCYASCMGTALRKPMTLQEFLAWEERQELRYEFDGFGPVAMTGGTVEHSAIQGNLITALGIRLRGGQCRVHGSHLKILVADRIRYPDAFVTCGPASPGSTVVETPVVVFEILSPGTAATDRIVKNEEYRSTPSIQRYVMLEQARQAATVFARQNEDWVGHVLVGNTTIDMPEIGISVPLAELYEGVALAQPDEDTVDD
jgi:Uma2 family endonuclease